MSKASLLQALHETQKLRDKHRTEVDDLARQITDIQNEIYKLNVVIDAYELLINLAQDKEDQ